MIYNIHMLMTCTDSSSSSAIYTDCLSHFQLLNENLLHLKTSNYKNIVHGFLNSRGKKKKSLKIHSFSIHGEFFYLHLQRTLQTYSQKESKLYLLSSLEETSIFISLISFFFFLFVLGILLFLKL